ncbi:MAG: hypothetical protein HC794_05025 [Nitrospiraceae bacterium]|nr:hypothetical protein [Nitrospiraceae bacterium]
MMLAQFLWIDSTIVLVYLIAMFVMGLYFASKNQNTDDYFLGGRNLPGWALGLSMLSTSISSVTFIALPAAALAKDYRLLVPNLMFPVASILAVLLIIPVFRRTAATTAFEYLEQRFGVSVRLYGAALFIITQLVRSAMVLYLVGIPIASLTGLPILAVIIVGGLFVCAYTMGGGFNAVVWTDVAQTFVLLGGGIFMIAYVIFRVPGGLGEVLAVGWENDKFGVGPMSFNLTERTVWTMLIVGLIGFASDLVSNQTVVQRYLAAKTEREAKKATLLSAVMAIPTC